MSERTARMLSWLGRLGLGGVFLVAGWTKLLDPSAFALEIARYELLHEHSGLVAAALPATELLLGAMVIAAPHKWRSAAALSLALLMLIFTAAAASAIARGLDISCGCFGESSGELTWTTLARDLVLLGVSLWLVREPGPSAQPTGSA